MLWQNPQIQQFNFFSIFEKMVNLKQPKSEPELQLTLQDYLDGIQESVVHKGLISFIKSSFLSLSKVTSTIIRLLNYFDSLEGTDDDERLFEQLLMEGSVYDLMKTMPIYLAKLRNINGELVSDLREKLKEIAPYPKVKHEVDKLARDKDYYLDEVCPIDSTDNVGDMLKLWARVVNMGHKSGSQANLKELEGNLDKLMNRDLPHGYSGDEIYTLKNFEGFLDARDTNPEELTIILTSNKGSEKNSMKKFKMKQVSVEKSDTWKKLEKFTGFGYKYNSAGQLIYKGVFKDGLENGQGKLYYKNSQILYNGEFSNGKKNGNAEAYSSSGNILYRYFFLEKKN